MIRPAQRVVKGRTAPDDSHELTHVGVRKDFEATNTRSLQTKVSLLSVACKFLGHATYFKVHVSQAQALAGTTVPANAQRGKFKPAAARQDPKVGFPVMIRTTPDHLYSRSVFSYFRAL